MKLLNVLLVSTVLAHGTHETDLKEPLPAGLTWEQWHMKQEHGLDEFTPEVFFDLHDIKSKGYLDKNDVLNAYGLSRDEVVGKGDGLGSHDDSEVIDEEKKASIFSKIMLLMDSDIDQKITREEYLKFAENGEGFPDLGVGVGHHGDFEHEYEVHHWNKYHRDQDPDIKIVHKEDIEHELLHHEHEIEHGEDIPNLKLFTNEEFESFILVENIPDFFKN